MLRVGGPPQPDPTQGQPPVPDQMQASSQPQVMPDAPNSAGGDTDCTKELVTALTHLRLAMELVISCISKYQGMDQGGEPDADEAPQAAANGPAVKDDQEVT